MRLQVDIFREDVVEILRDLSPLHFQMAAHEGERRWLELQAPRAEGVKFIAGEGIEVRARASLRYELSKVLVTAAISEVVVMLRPTILDSTMMGRRLPFEVQLQSAELNADLDGGSGLAGAVRDSLACGKQRLGWAFGEAMTVHLQVSSGADLSALFLVRMQDRAISVTESSIRLAVNFRGTFCRSERHKASKSRDIQKFQLNNTELPSEATPRGLRAQSGSASAKARS